MKKIGENQISKELNALRGRDEYKFLEGILAEMTMFEKGANIKRFEQINNDLKSDNEALMLQGLIELNSELTMTQETT